MVLAERNPMDLVIDSALPPPAELALADLAKALAARSIQAQRQESLGAEAQPALVIGIAGASPLVDELLQTEKIQMAASPEALCIRPLAGGQRVLLAASDARGLSYALLEIAEAVGSALPDEDWRLAVEPTLESPFLSHRSATIHLFNPDLEDAWYFSDRFWQDYLGMLARCRFNNFSLVFADQTNYMNPVYSWLVELPGFAGVKVRDLTSADRQRHLAMLQRIAEMTRERGLDFTFGVWTQKPVDNYASESEVEGLPEGEGLIDYCARGLEAVLRACPAVNRVQFRMNYESGIPEDQQAHYYQSQFDAVRHCGRPVQLDLRYKGLQPETIEQALATGLDVTISTKFWCEHFGLPYHPTAEDTHYRESRYGYGAMLARPRDFRVVYRLWTVGSHRLLLWGDPEYAARFARSCQLGGGEGFEVFAPLTNKGFTNSPGDWRIFADNSYESYRWEQQRYWLYYLAFGRLGYDPECRPPVWQRQLRRRFGPAAPALEAAFRSASQVLPLITAARVPSASEWRWWPEMDTGDQLPEYIRAVPSDTAQFYGIRTWEKTPGWHCENWDKFPPGYVEDAVEGCVSARWTPFQVSAEFSRLARETLAALDHASALVPDPTDPEFRATALDLEIHACLASYHAAKTLAATHLAFFEATGDAGRLAPAQAQMQQSLSAWQRLVAITDGVYHDNLEFGHTAASKRCEDGYHHAGHWRDRLAEVERDAAYLEALRADHPGPDQPSRVYPGETPPSDLPSVEHTPASAAAPGIDLELSARLSDAPPGVRMNLHYRALDQTADWQRLPMPADGDGCFAARIPGAEISRGWDLMYYLEVLVEGGGRLWPAWTAEQPYIIVPVSNQ